MQITNDIGCAAIIALIERLSLHNTNIPDSWVKINAKHIEEMTCGVVAYRTVSKKIGTLKDMGILEISLDKNNWPSYRLNANELANRIGKSHTPSTPAAYTPSTLAAYTSTPAAYTLYAGSVDIKDIYKNTRETIQTTDLIEKEKSNKEEDVNPEVRTLLKAYDKIPKNKRDRFCRGSINSLYKNYGDALERIASEYGVDNCLLAMDRFKQDEYWAEKGFPLRGFLKQIENYLENASEECGGYEGVGKKEKTAPRPESAQAEAIQVSIQQPASESSDREFLRKKVRRADVVMNMLKQVSPGELEEFRKETISLDAVTPERIEHWYRIASAKWKEIRGSYEPTGGTTPLC